MVLTNEVTFKKKKSKVVGRVWKAEEITEMFAIQLKQIWRKILLNVPVISASKYVSLFIPVTRNRGSRKYISLVFLLTFLSTLALKI